MSFYEQLLKETQSGKDYLLGAPIIDDVFDGRFNKDTYLAFLHQAYNHVRHTAPLLAAAQQHLRPDQQWVSKALEDYIEEEAGHEVWILNDIEACGENRQLWAEKPPEFAT
ncbi:MAG: iron-containing redox enzyme family protein, partial [Congregibacter sp.]|nr:iron-containing redox enzyme family protein [Congregibacter sp.]